MASPEVMRVLTMKGYTVAGTSIMQELYAMRKIPSAQAKSKEELFECLDSFALYPPPPIGRSGKPYPRNSEIPFDKINP
jgi:hypothetical protein